MNLFLRFFRGLLTLLRAVSLIFRTRKIRRLAYIPIIINVIIFITTGCLLIWLGAAYINSYVGEGTLGFSATVAAVLIGIALWLLISFFAFGFIAPLLSAPFNDPLSRSVERIVSGQTGETPGSGLVRDNLRAIGAALKIFAAEIFILGPLLLLLLIPVIGALIFTLPAAFFLALSYLDYPLDRRRMKLREKFSYAFSHLPEVMGLGSGCLLLASIPIINIFLIPTATTAATLLFLNLSKKAELLSPPDTSGN
jgi:CysZ protein